MTDNTPNDTDETETEDGAERYTVRGGTLTIGGEEIEYSDIEWTAEADEDAPAVSTRDLQRELTGTLTFSGPVEELEADVTITDSEGNKRTHKKAKIQTQEQVREEAHEIRANAPPEYDLDDRTADINDIILALERAKERGVSEVYVNDDGMARSPDPRITNNHVHYYGSGPKPGELEEWVEL